MVEKNRCGTANGSSTGVLSLPCQSVNWILLYLRMSCCILLSVVDLVTEPCFGWQHFCGEVYSHPGPPITSCSS